MGRLSKELREEGETLRYAALTEAAGKIEELEKQVASHDDIIEAAHHDYRKKQEVNAALRARIKYLEIQIVHHNAAIKEGCVEATDKIENVEKRVASHNDIPHVLRAVAGIETALHEYRVVNAALREINAALRERIECLIVSAKPFPSRLEATGER